MRFPKIDHVALPVTFEEYVPGNLHTDGRRYLPLLLFRPARGPLLGVVDRHHYVDQTLAGQPGIVRLVFLLSTIRLQPPGQQRQAIEAARMPRGVATMPDAYGRVREVLSWELERGHLPYDSLYAELILDVGGGTIGVRTHVTAQNMEQAIGAARVQPGDWLHVSRSRIDVLGFEPTTRSSAIATPREEP